MEAAVKARKIKVIWHFTRQENLPNILATGLKSRAQLEVEGECVVFNDALRLDGNKNAICASVSFPNYKMFYRLRQENPDVDWVVLALRPEILWLKDCAFCVENAASASVTAIQLAARKTVGAFETMFNEVDGKPSRSKLRLSNSCPTNPQAEVLIFDHIERENIFGVACETKALRDKLRVAYPDVEIEKMRAFFKYRPDFEHWR